MDDSTAKMFEKNINYLIDVCLQLHPLGEEYVSDWKECMIGYSEVYEVMSSKREQSFNEVCYFVMISDSFMERYIDLTGHDGMTNYFHMLRDGHIAYRTSQVRQFVPLLATGMGKHQLGNEEVLPQRYAERAR
eukprot:scaffold12557_cov75-Cyclotella_meneghiniana.AAC.4